jgi:hypothetical protein
MGMRSLAGGHGRRLEATEGTVDLVTGEVGEG